MLSLEDSRTNPKLNSIGKISFLGWVMLWLPWSVLAFVAVLNFSIGMVLTSMQNDIGFSTVQAGYLSSIGWFITVVLMFPLAGLTNRYGAKKVLTIIFIVIGIMFLIQSIAKTFTVLIIARLVGLGCAVGITPALSYLKQNWVPLQKITSINGIESLMNPVGQLIAMLAVPLLLEKSGGWRTVLQILGVLILLVGIVWSIAGRDAPRKEAGESRRTSDEKVKHTSVFSALRFNVIWLAPIAVMGTSVVWTAYFTFWPTYATQNLHLSLSLVGMLFAAFPIGSIVASLVMPPIVEKAGIEKPFVWVWGLILPATYYSMLISASPILIALGAFFAGFGAFAFVPFTASQPFKIRGILPEEITVGSGLMMLFVGIGSGLGPIICSHIYTATGNLQTALALCCLFPITLVLFGLFLPERGRIALAREEVEATSQVGEL